MFTFALTIEIKDKTMNHKTNLNSTGEEVVIEIPEVSSYNYTRVNIYLSLPYRRLHLLYKVPAMVVEEYWKSVLKKITDEECGGVVDLSVANGVNKDKEKELEQIREATNMYDRFAKFPELTVTDKYFFDQLIESQAKLKECEEQLKQYELKAKVSSIENDTTLSAVAVGVAIVALIVSLASIVVAEIRGGH